MLICSKGQCVFHFPAFGKGNHVVVMDWVTITLVSEAGMIYLSAFQLSMEDKGEGELWRGLQGEKMRRVGEGDREKQDLHPDGNVETRVGATAGNERPQWRLFINSCSSTALKWKGLETIPSAPSLGCLGFQQGSSYILIAAHFRAQISPTAIASDFEDHREAFFFSLFNSLYISKKVHSASLWSSASEQGVLQQEQPSNEIKAQELQRICGTWIFRITETQNNLSSERSYKGSVPTHLSVMRSPCFNITDSVPSMTNYLVFWYLESISLFVITSRKFGLGPLRI